MANSHAHVAPVLPTLSRTARMRVVPDFFGWQKSGILKDLSLNKIEVHENFEAEYDFKLLNPEGCRFCGDKDCWWEDCEDDQEEAEEEEEEQDDANQEYVKDDSKELYVSVEEEHDDDPQEQVQEDSEQLYIGLESCPEIGLISESNDDNQLLKRARSEDDDGTGDDDVDNLKPAFCKRQKTHKFGVELEDREPKPDVS